MQYEARECVHQRVVVVGWFLFNEFKIEIKIGIDIEMKVEIKLKYILKLGLKLGTEETWILKSRISAFGWRRVMKCCYQYFCKRYIINNGI